MKQNTKSILAKNLERLMMEAKINQVELAKKTKLLGRSVNQKTISNYMNVDSDDFSFSVNPRLDKIDALADYFGVKTTDLLNEDFFKHRDTTIPLDDNRLESSISEGAALLAEAGIIGNDKAVQLVEMAKDIAKATSIIYNSNNTDSNKVIFNFVSYLNKRKASA